MVAPLEQLHQDLSSLCQSSKKLAQELQSIVDSYLTVLGKVVKTQLVQTSFYLCTQVYAAAFLKRSFSERQALQQEIRAIGQRAADELIDLQKSLSEIQAQPDTNPVHLLEVWEGIEQGMVQALHTCTRQLNQLLQDQNIAQFTSLDKLLDMAETAESVGRSITNPPHLLKAVMDGKETDQDDPVQVIALYLQLADLEFTNTELMSWRQKLRPLLQKLNKLQRSYLDKQEEQTVAEAISAWRASWVTDEADG